MASLDTGRVANAPEGEDADAETRLPVSSFERGSKGDTSGYNEERSGGNSAAEMASAAVSGDAAEQEALSLGEVAKSGSFKHFYDCVEEEFFDNQATMQHHRSEPHRMKSRQLRK